MKKLDFITPENRTEKMKLFIDNNTLAYYDESGEKHKLLDLKSNDRPVYISELYERLKNRHFNITERKVVNDDRLYLHPDTTVTGTSDFNKQTYTSSDSSKSLLLHDILIGPSEVTAFTNEYMKTISTSSFYSSSKITVDILESSITVDLINKNTYTNTISLQTIEKKTAKPGISGKIDLTVKYTKNYRIFGQDLTFEAFKYNDSEINPESSKLDFVSTLGDVRVEYTNGVIRVIPESTDVDECIISNCILTYGCI